MPARRDDITDEAVRRLASYGCTQEEVAHFFDTSRSVITAKYGQAFRLGAADVRKNVRMWQMRRAKKGSDVMLIHLGKHYCGQADKNPGQEVKVVVERRDRSEEGETPEASSDPEGGES